MVDRKVGHRSVALTNGRDVLWQELNRMHDTRRSSPSQGTRGHPIKCSCVQQDTRRHDALEQQQGDERVKDALKGGLALPIMSV